MNLQTTAIAILASALLAVGGYALGHWKGYGAGQQAERDAWQTRESEELRAANAALTAAQARAAALERQAAEQIAEIDAAHQQEAQRVQARHDDFVRRLYSGAIRLPGCPARESAPGSAQGAPAASAGLGDGEAPGNVPGALRSAVAGGAALAREADAVALQLSGLQEYYWTVVVPVCESK